MKSLLLSVLAVPLVVLAVAGCKTPGRSGDYPCEKCTYGYVPVRESADRRVWCIKDGKTLDCMKAPAECKECARIQQNPK